MGKISTVKTKKQIEKLLIPFWEGEEPPKKVVDELANIIEEQVEFHRLKEKYEE